jgi:L-seryl-tRNA(Ser) seleniumtransferase
MNTKELNTNSMAKSELYRLLPSVDELLRREGMQSIVGHQGHAATVAAARSAMEELRGRIARGELSEEQVAAAMKTLPQQVAARLQATLAYSLRPVINATGVILHTNLGRAPLSSEALQHVSQIAQGYSNIELDLTTGDRGKRDVHVDRLFAKLLNAAAGRDVATIVVNNNAAAVLLTLNALAEGGEVVVSRGELVEIGGSFRIPDVMAKSGALLREVGTTNRTRISDYEQAISEKTKLLLRVHRSNFEIRGFTEQPSLQELADLARKRGIPLMEDLGSGDIFDLRTVGVHGEPTIAASLRTGVGIVTFSGDKLLGGPQAGLISGAPELVTKARKNPLFRALRVDKMFYAALEATLLAYLREDYDAIPALRMMRLTVGQIDERAEHMMRKLHISSPKLRVEVVEAQSVIGGGSAPGATLPSRAVAVSSDEMGADEMARRLRGWDTPVIARVEEGRLLLDLRTVELSQDEIVLRALEQLPVIS